MIVADIENTFKLTQHGFVVAIEIWSHYVSFPILQEVVRGIAMLISTHHLPIIWRQGDLLAVTVNDNTTVNYFDNLVAEERIQK